jgi:transcription elongation factor
LGGVDRFPNRDGGGERITEAERLRRKRLEEQQAASDQVTSGTTAMRSGGRANGVAQRGWTRGKFR